MDGRWIIVIRSENTDTGSGVAIVFIPCTGIYVMGITQRWLAIKNQHGWKEEWERKCMVASDK